MIEMDERAALFARRGKLERETENFWLDDGAHERAVVEVVVGREELSLLRAAERRDRSFLARMLRAVQESTKPKDAWTVWLDDAALVALGHGKREEDERGDEGVPPLAQDRPWKQPRDPSARDGAHGPRAAQTS